MAEWYILVGAAAFLLALSNIVRKHILNHEHSMEMLAAQAPFRFLFTLFLIPVATIPSWPTLLLIFLVSLVLFTGFLFRNKLYRHLPISSAAPITNISPVFTLIIAGLILGEKPGGVQLLGIALIIFGGYVLDLTGKDVFGPLKMFKKNKMKGIIITSLILSAMMGVLDKTMLSMHGIPVFTYLFWLYLFISFLSIGVHWKVHKFDHIGEDLRKGWMWLGLTTLLSFAAVIFFYQGIRHPAVLIGLAIPILRMSSVLETLLGGSLFQEEGLMRKALACGIMIVGAILIV